MLTHTYGLVLRVSLQANKKKCAIADVVDCDDDDDKKNMFFRLFSVYEYGKWMDLNAIWIANNKKIR